jgi:rhodanese-related sulfurtransferase
MTIKTISPQDLYRHIKLGHNVVLLDVRSQEEYDEGHIAGADLHPLASFDAHKIIDKICAPYPFPPTIYVTCASGTEAMEACQQLAEAGYEYIINLEEGMFGWITAGLPIKRTMEEDEPLELMPHSTLELLKTKQQVELVIGSIIAIGTLLGTFMNPGFLAIPFVVGVGFTYKALFGADHLTIPPENILE